MTARMRFERDYYGLMGLHPEATEEEIRKAYRRLALQWHPDRNPGNPEAAERFKEISEAYAVLIDPAKRRAYDRARAAGATHEFRPNREDLFRDLFADRQASAIFEELAREFERLGMRVDHRYFRQTLFGGRTVVTGGVIIITPLTPVLALLRLARAALRGASAVSTSGRPDAQPLPRPGSVLTGIGRMARWFLGLPSSTAAAAMTTPDDVVMPLRLTRAEAERGGSKRIALGPHGADEVLVNIPPSTRNGTRLRLRGRGRPRADGSRGDVYLTVELV
jgi:DnaJ-class molecular chaperone